MKIFILLLIIGVLFTDTFAQTYCGTRSSNSIGPRVLGDDEPKQGEFPWMAAVFSEGAIVNNQPQLEYKCGASIIHPEVLLTVAHCVPNNQTYQIKAGMVNVEIEDGVSGTQQRRVNNVIVHPQYKVQTLEYDVAILILNSPLIFDENINAVCLPVPELGDRDDKICQVSGWGKDKFGASGKLQTILKKVDLPIVPNQICEKKIRDKLRRMYRLPSSLMCAGGEKGKDTCEGDGGSALVCVLPDHMDTYYELGFVVGGIGCGEENTPGLYANILQFKSWIDQQFNIYKYEKTYDEF
ncbi:hypothetical protein ILUMI_04064 [Ignelater luminosus]|uniref:Peptidase S1 domain-containing protein n=1 Tax=Ignelater luminosus TaxID=2038154 RepID=A0A8K0GJX3_IGNLU|nr:hypothetical protein ILUMI_04064 [Ignelater luminosus]